MKSPEETRFADIHELEAHLQTRLFSRVREVLRLLRGTSPTGYGKQLALAHHLQ